MANLSRLRWQCRRGTRELDILLENYLDHLYTDAILEEQQCFEELLAFEDSELLAFFMGERLPSLKNLEDLVRKIREFSAKNSASIDL